MLFRFFAFAKSRNLLFTTGSRHLFFTDFPQRTTGVILAGLGLAAIGFGGRYAAKHFRDAGKIFQKMESIGGNGGAFSKYYRGGFDAKMSRREASLILGVSPSASQAKIKEAHKRIMLLNHPDRGGSPYVAAKVNEAKDYLETKR